MKPQTHSFGYQHIAISGVTQAVEIYHAVPLGRKASVFRTTAGNKPYLPVITEHCLGLPDTFFECVKQCDYRIDQILQASIEVDSWRQRNLFRAVAVSSLLLAPLMRVKTIDGQPLLARCTARPAQIELIFDDVHRHMDFYTGLPREATDREMRQGTDQMFIGTIGRLSPGGCLPQSEPIWQVA